MDLYLWKKKFLSFILSKLEITIDYSIMIKNQNVNNSIIYDISIVIKYSKITIRLWPELASYFHNHAIIEYNEMTLEPARLL